MKRVIAALVALAVLAGVIARIAAGRPDATPAFSGTVRLGFVAGLDGADARGGQEMLRAVRDLVAQVNRQGGVGGLRVELAVEDDGNDPARAATAARRLAADPSVVAVIGHNYSGASLAAAPVYAEAGLPAVTPASTVPGLGDGPERWVFRTIYDDDQQGEFLVSYAQQALGAGQLALATVPDAYGERLDRVVRAAAAQRGLPIAAAWQGDPASPDAAARLVQHLAGLPADTVVVLLAHQVPAAALVRAVRDAGLKLRLLAPDALGSVDFARAFAGLPREALEPGFYTNGLYVSVPFLADTANAEARALIGRLEADGPLTTWGAPYAYDAA